jgi:hypothetical protein
MKKGRLLIAAAALVSSASFVGMGTAGAAVPAFDAKLLGPVHIDGDDPSVAHVRGKYVCDNVESAQWHLWVSLKQNADATQDPLLEQEGSSAVATTWVQSHPVDFVCDGRQHVQSFTIDTLEQGFGEAIKGEGWVQFCLIDFADESFERAAIIQEWRSVN